MVRVIPRPGPIGRVPRPGCTRFRGLLEDAFGVGVVAVNVLAVARRLEADGVLAMASELAAMSGVPIVPFGTALDASVRRRLPDGSGECVPVVVGLLEAPGAMVEVWWRYPTREDLVAVVLVAACTILV